MNLRPLRSAARWLLLGALCVSCSLNPIGEDPGASDESSFNSGAGPAGSAFQPGAGVGTASPTPTPGVGAEDGSELIGEPGAAGTPATPASPSATQPSTGVEMDAPEAPAPGQPDPEAPGEAMSPNEDTGGDSAAEPTEEGAADAGIGDAGVPLTPTSDAGDGGSP